MQTATGHLVHFAWLPPPQGAGQTRSELGAHVLGHHRACSAAKDAGPLNQACQTQALAKQPWARENCTSACTLARGIQTHPTAPARKHSGPAHWRVQCGQKPTSTPSTAQPLGKWRLQATTLSSRKGTTCCSTVPAAVLNDSTGLFFFAPFSGLPTCRKVVPPGWHAWRQSWAFQPLAACCSLRKNSFRTVPVDLAKQPVSEREGAQ